MFVAGRSDERNGILYEFCHWNVEKAEGDEYCRKSTLLDSSDKKCQQFSGRRSGERTASSYG